ncbi:MAG: hypothetical protein ER33_07845 [Cyanobium sp. CACIAM 14]|nr:MAG: hypothetical protein ER33_07845 [Cyanobium sp. CACIAM 14]
MAAVLACLPVLVLPLRAEALTLLDQPANGYDLPSQDFPDFPAFTAAGFDDFSLTQPTALTAITAFGTEQGTPSANVQVRAAIWSTPDLSGSPLVSFTGTETGSDLVFDPMGYVISPGTYWLSAQIVRPITGGQWYWQESDTLTGADALWQNPGGGFGYGPAPGPLPDGGQAFAFRIDGLPAVQAQSVPGPLPVFGSLTALVWSRRLRKRIKATRDVPRA